MTAVKKAAPKAPKTPKAVATVENTNVTNAPEGEVVAKVETPKAVAKKTERPEIKDVYLRKALGLK